MNLKSTLTSTVLPFEHGCNNQWLLPSSGNITALKPSLASWLLDQDSLTQRLQSYCQNFSITVLREGITQVSAQERQLFNGVDNLYCREVLLICDGQPQVYARTLMPQSTLSYANRLLATLGNTSLGEVLFRSPHMKRQAIETTSFSTDSAMAQFASSLSLEAENTLWARRSIFTLEDNPMMVSEVFLPNSYAYEDVVS